MLLDEIEKAHPDVFNVLLQVLDDGRLTDGQGRTVDFTNAVLIMTSNLPGDPLDYFKPEFVNRIDEIVRFRPLGREDLCADRGDPARSARRRLADRRLALEVTPEAEICLASTATTPTSAPARLRRVIQREIGDPLALALLEGRYTKATPFGSRSRTTSSSFARPPCGARGEPRGNRTLGAVGCPGQPRGISKSCPNLVPLMIAVR